MLEVGLPKDAMDFHSLGIVRRNKGGREREEYQQPEQDCARQQEAGRPGGPRFGAHRWHRRSHGAVHVAAPSAMRGSSQATTRSVTSETTMKIVAIARMPTCTVG